jgi:outer membrane protein assembly factor BamB
MARTRRSFVVLTATGVFPETSLLREWPEGGPAVAWKATGIGGGFSSAMVVNGMVYVTGMLGKDEGNLFVIDEATGALKHTFPYGQETLDDQAEGPRSTPTWDGTHLYFMSGLGVIYCMDPTDGNIVWSVSMVERFGAREIIWDYSESLLVDGDRVLCTPGGPEVLMAALDKNTGATVWTTTGLDELASYCSPIIVQHNEQRLLLNAVQSHIIGVNPDTGALLWAFAHKVNWDIHGVIPVYHDGLVYYTGGDGIGGGALELSADGNSITSKWTDTTLDCLHHGVVFIDGYLYGTGYKKGGNLVCLEMETGKVMWQTREVQQGALVAADGMLYIYEGPKVGVVSLVKASPEAFERVSQFPITDGTGKHWAHPTIANSRLYIRRGDTLIAYDVAAK